MSSWNVITPEEEQLNDISELRIDVRKLLTKIYELERSAFLLQGEIKNREEHANQQIKRKDTELAMKDEKIEELKQEIAGLRKKLERQ